MTIKGPRANNLNIWPLDWDAMLGAERAVWRATQAIRNDAARPRPASQMFKLFARGPKPIRTDEDLRGVFHRLESIYQAEEGTPEADERDVLVILIEAYENQRYAFGPADPVEAIKFRMETAGADRA